MFQYDAKDGNTMKKLKLRVLSAKIEWHWLFIKRTRKKGNSLLSSGMPLTSQKFYILNRKLSSHSTKVLKTQAVYDKMGKDVN